MLCLADSVTFTEVDDELVLLDQHSGKYWLCNVTATPMLQRLREGCTADDLVQHLHQVFPEVDAHRDVGSFLDMAVRAGLVIER